MFESIKYTQRYSIILKLHIFEGKNEIEKEIILFTSKMCR